MINNITLVNNIINNGYSQNNTMMLPMQTIQFNTNPFPLMQHKKMYTKGIWDANADPEYKKKHNKNLKDYDLGPVYGYQWRNFNGENKDQLMYIINELKNKSFNRRLFMSAWNPLQLDDMVLPPFLPFYTFFEK